MTMQHVAAPVRTIAHAKLGGWLHLCNGLDPERDGGMVPSILGMTQALAEQGGQITIVTPTPSRLGETPISPALTLRGPETDLEAAVAAADVVHIHGIWQGHTRRGCRAAIRARVPYMIAAHGMVEPWALRHKALKKAIYTALVEGPNLRHASCLHALSRPEIDHLRAIAPNTPVCLVPNGVDLAALADLPPRSELEAQYPELQGKFVLLFFGRLHGKKGLDMLAEALGILADERPDLHVVLAGRDDGALAEFQKRTAANGVADRFTFVGHVAGEQARRVWGAADAFVLPSYSEGFSMAILEALACRLPALITTSCHFPELAEVDGAVVVEPTLPAVTLGLRDLLARSSSETQAMAGRGRSLVQKRYTWDRQAERLGDVYRWLAGGGPAPESVVMPRGTSQWV